MSSSSNNNISLLFSNLDELAPVVSQYTRSPDFGMYFNNLLEEVLVTGQDQPVTAYPNHSALESSSAQINEELYNQLSKSVKESVSVFKSELKSQSSELTGRPTTPAGKKTAVYFELPEAFNRNDPGVEKLVPQEANQNPNTQIECKFTFFERLGGWSIERTRRPNGKNSDMYYRQEGAKSTFRSVREVVRYIMYEEEPATNKGKKQEQGEDGSEIKRSRKRNLNHYNESTVTMEIGGPSHVMNCDDFTTDDVEMIGDDEPYYLNAFDQEWQANGRFTTGDGPTVADDQSYYLDDEMNAIIGNLNPHWVDENLMLEEVLAVSNIK